MAQVSLRKIVKAYEGGVQAVKGIDLEIADHEFVVLVGPSGCGKSTTLRMIAGLEEITSGDIAIGGTVVNDIPPRDRDIAMVFQNYALYPHMSVYDNMAFGLMLRKFPKAEIDRRVTEAVFILLGQRDRVIAAVGFDERNERHHLLFRYEGIVFIGFAVKNLSVRRNGQTDLSCQPCGIFADKVAIQHVGTTRFLRRTECFGCERGDLCGVEPISAVISDRGHQ